MTENKYFLEACTNLGYDRETRQSDAVRQELTIWKSRTT